MSRGRAWMALAVAAALMAAGCKHTQHKLRLKVGVVDTARVVNAVPGATDMRLDWMKDASALYLRSLSSRSQPQWTSLHRDAQQSSAEWEKQMHKFVDSVVKSIRADSAEVAREKGLDIVIVQSPYLNPIKYYSGEDITLDVILKMKKG